MRSTLGRVTAAMLIGAVSSSAVAQNPGCPGWLDPVGKKIIGGKATTAQLWPSQAALRLTAPDDKRVEYLCGGTVIAQDTIMTAAHCFDEIKRESSGRWLSTHDEAQTVGWRLDIVLGADDLSAVTTTHAYPISDVRIREGYAKNEAPTLGNDIALVMLARRWSGPVATLSLDPTNDPPDGAGAALTVAGFGLLRGTPQGGAAQTHSRSDGSSVSAGSLKLQQVGLPMVSTNQCAAEWKKLDATTAIGAGQLCAGYEAVPDMTQWKDSCGGDSGGPLVHYDRRGCPTHVGLVSWGHPSCGTPKAYGVYTRLSHHAAWLRKHVPAVLARPVVSTVTGASADLSAKEFVALASSVTDGRRGTVRIAVEGGAVVRNGKFYRFSVASEVAGRLVIFDANADGIVTQIFPNEHVLRDELSLVRKGQEVTVPGIGWGVQFRAGPPFGKGLLIALVVPPDFPVHLLVTAPARTKGFIAERSAVGYLMNLLQQITTHATSRSATTGAGAAWAITTFEYEVRP